MPSSGATGASALTATLRSTLSLRGAGVSRAALTSDAALQLSRSGMACLAGVPAAAVLAFATRNLSDAGAADEMIAPSLPGQQLPGLTCASGSVLGLAAADTGASAAGAAPFMAISFDIAVSVAALGGARALQAADDPLGLAGVLAGGPMPSPLSPLQRAVLQAIVTLSAGLQLPAPSAVGATPVSAFGGQMGPWLAPLGAPAVSSSAVQLLLNGLAYYNLNGTNMLALRAALGVVPTSAPLTAAGCGGSTGDGFSIAAMAVGAAGVLILEAAIVAVVLISRRRRARARLVGSAAASSRRTVILLSGRRSGDAKRRPIANAADAEDVGSVGVNPLHQASAVSASGTATPRAAKPRSAGEKPVLMVVSSLAGVANARERAAVRASATDGTVNPLHLRSAGGGAR
jgi:hypothetical protein